MKKLKKGSLLLLIVGLLTPYYTQGNVIIPKTSLLLPSSSKSASYCPGQDCCPKQVVLRRAAVTSSSTSSTKTSSPPPKKVEEDNIGLVVAKSTVTDLLRTVLDVVGGGKPPSTVSVTDILAVNPNATAVTSGVVLTKNPNATVAAEVLTKKSIATVPTTTCNVTAAAAAAPLPMTHCKKISKREFDAQCPVGRKTGYLSWCPDDVVFILNDFEPTKSPPRRRYPPVNEALGGGELGSW